MILSISSPSCLSNLGNRLRQYSGGKVLYRKLVLPGGSGSLMVGVNVFVVTWVQMILALLGEHLLHLPQYGKCTTIKPVMEREISLQGTYIHDEFTLSCPSNDHNISANMAGASIGRLHIIIHPTALLSYGLPSTQIQKNMHLAECDLTSKPRATRRSCTSTAGMQFFTKLLLYEHFHSCSLHTAIY